MKTETQVRFRFAPSSDDVQRGDVREHMAKAGEKNKRFDGKTTLHLVWVGAVHNGGLLGLNGVMASTILSVRCENYHVIHNGKLERAMQ
jgi:hypothetical protein